MEKDGIEIEIEKSESEIREERADNVRGYFEAKKSGTSFTPSEVKPTKRVSLGRETSRSFDRVEEYIRDNDTYSDAVKSNLDHIKTFMDLFLR